MSAERYARVYFTTLAAFVLLMAVLITWGHSRGGSGDRSIDDLTKALHCDSLGLTPAQCAEAP